MRDYTVWNPSGNVTVFGTVQEWESPAEAGAALLRAEPRAEQAGFLRYDKTGCDVRLEMAGGEFCGNATLCAAAEYGLRSGMEIGTEKTVRVSCSGVAEILEVLVKRENETGFRGEVKMPRPVGILEANADCVGKDFAIPYPMVILPGIGHVIIEGPETVLRAEEVVRNWCNGLKLEALGILFYDERKGTMVPFVYVKGVDTVFRENACASGTAALGYYLACRNGKAVEKELQNPGGLLKVWANPVGEVVLSGTTELMNNEY